MNKFYPGWEKKAEYKQGKKQAGATVYPRIYFLLQ